MNTLDCGLTRQEKRRRLQYHAIAALVSVAALMLVAAALTAALWLASFFLYASAHVNPLHAGFHAWPDAALAWYDGRLPQAGRRIAASALFALVLAFGVPALGLYTLRERAGRTHLYGSARFASEAEIRRAGLL
jgi:type IV secretory pathway TraG/TraD family ATPase VirD4